MTHIGIDLSLTSTGLALLEPGEAPVIQRVPSKPTGTSLVERYERLNTIVKAIAEFSISSEPNASFKGRTFYIEAPTYATNSGHQHDRSGLWWMVVQHLIRFEAHVIEVSPTTVKAFATGKGNADKTAMTVTAAREFPGASLRFDDEVDALWIATLAEYVDNPDAGRVGRTVYRDKAASAVPRR